MHSLVRRTSAHEPVEVQQKRFGYFPKTFRWRGKRYSVQSIERCWAQRRLGFRKHTLFTKPYLYFRVRCREGIFDLAQDIHADAWRIRT